MPDLWLICSCYFSRSFRSSVRRLRNAADQLLAVAGSLATGHVFQILRAQPTPTNGSVPTAAPAAENGPVEAPAVADPVPAPAPEPGERNPVAAPVPVEVEILPPPAPVTNLRSARRAAAKKQGPVEIIEQTGVVVEERPLVPPTGAAATSEPTATR
jgi:hypothetical protein